MDDVFECVVMYLMSVGDQVVSLATLWDELEPFSHRFAAYRARRWHVRVSRLATRTDAHVRRDTVRVLLQRGVFDEIAIVRRVVESDNKQQVQVPLSNNELLDAPVSSYRTVERGDDRAIVVSGDARADDAMARRVLIGVRWAALLRGWGVVAAVNMSTAPMASLAEKHVRLLVAIARGDFRGLLKSKLDDAFSDDCKSISHYLKHLVAIGLVHKVNVVVEGKSSSSSCLWLPPFAPLADASPPLPPGCQVALGDAELKHRIMAQLARMPALTISNRDVVAHLLGGRKERSQQLRDELARDGFIEVINALDYKTRKKEKSDQPSILCWRMLKPYEPPHRAARVAALTNFATNAGAAAAAADADDDDDNDDDNEGGDDDDNDAADGGGGGEDDDEGGAAVAAPMDAVMERVAHPVYQEMTLSDQVLRCIVDSGARGLSSREICTCLGLNEPHDMKRMMKMLTALSKQFGLKSHAFFVGKARHSRFTWVQSDAEAAIEANQAAQRSLARRRGDPIVSAAALIARRAEHVRAVLLECQAISRKDLLTRMREREDNPTLDRHTVERAIEFLNKNDFVVGELTTKVGKVKMPLVLLLAPGVVDDRHPAVAAACVKFEDDYQSRRQRSRVVGEWGDLVDVGPIPDLATLLAEQNEAAEAAKQELNALLPPPMPAGELEDAGELSGQMARIRMLHYGMCEAMRAKADGAAAESAVAVDRADVLSRLTLRQLARFAGVVTRELPPDLKSSLVHFDQVRLCDVAPAARAQIERVLSLGNTPGGPWRKTMKLMLKLGLVERVPTHKIEDRVSVKRSVKCAFSRPGARKTIDEYDNADDDTDSEEAFEVVRLDSSRQLAFELSFRSFWQRFEYGLRVTGKKTSDLICNGAFVIECRKPAHWADKTRAEDAERLLRRHKLADEHAERVVSLVETMDARAFLQWAESVGLAQDEKTALLLADALALKWIDAAAKDPPPPQSSSSAAVASSSSRGKRGPPTTTASAQRDAGYVFAQRVGHERFLHMPLRVQRRALRRAFALVHHHKLDHLDDETEEEDEDDDIVDLEPRRRGGRRKKNRTRAAEAEEEDDDDDDDTSDGSDGDDASEVGVGAGGGGRARQAGKRSRAGASGAHGRSEPRQVRYLSTAQMLSFACLLASRFVLSRRASARGLPESAAESVLSSVVPAALKEADIGSMQQWRDISKALGLKLVQCREQFKSLMRSEWFTAQLYTQIRRLADRQRMQLPAPFAWLNSYGSPMVPDVVLPASIDELREQYQVLDAFTFEVCDPFRAVPASFEPRGAAALFVADLLLLYMARVDDDVALAGAATSGALRDAAMQYLRDRFMVARNSTSRKTSHYELKDRPLDNERLANSTRARLERHLADVFDWNADVVGKSAEPLLPLSLADAAGLRGRVSQTPAAVDFGPTEPAGAVLAALEMWLYGDVAITAHLAPPEGVAASSGKVSAAQTGTWHSQLHERKHADAQRAALPHVSAALREPAHDYAGVVAALRGCTAARRVVVAAAHAGPRGLSGAEVEQLLFGDGIDPREFLRHNDAVIALDRRVYSHGTLLAALIADDGDARNAPLQRAIDPAELAFRYLSRDAALPAGFVAASPLPVDSCGARIARRAVLGHFERSPGVRAETLVERLFDREAPFPSLVSRVALHDQLHWLALHHVLVGSTYSERIWPSGAHGQRLIVSRSTRVRFYPPSPVLRLVAPKAHATEL